MINSINKLISNVNISNLKNSLLNYLLISRVFYKNPFKFLESDIFKNNFNIINTIGLILWTIVLLYFILTPLYIISGDVFVKLSFILRTILNVLIYTFSFYILSKVFFIRNSTLKNTFILLSYIFCMGVPLFILLALPYLIVHGNIDIFFGGISSNLDEVELLFKEYPYITFYGAILPFPFVIFYGTILPIIWFSKIYKVSKMKIFLLITVYGLVLGEILSLINPMLNKIFDKISIIASILF